MTEPLVVDDRPVGPEESARAARTVRLASRAAIYRVADDGLPVDVLLRAAIIEARTEQIRAMRYAAAQTATAAESAALSPLGVPLQSASIEGASWTAGDADSLIPAPYRMDAATGLSRAAYEVLLDAGLLAGPVVTYG